MKRFCFRVAVLALACFCGSVSFACDDCPPALERYAHHFKQFDLNDDKAPASDKLASRFVWSRFDASRFTRSDVYVLGLPAVDSPRPFYVTKLGRLETISGVVRKISPSTRREFGEWGDVVRCRYVDGDGEEYTILYVYAVWTGSGFAILSDDSFIGGSLRFNFEKFPEFLKRFDALNLSDAVVRPDWSAPVLALVNGASLTLGGLCGFFVPLRWIRSRREDSEDAENVR